MSSALNGSSAMQCFEGSNAIKICDGITFDFCTDCHIYRVRTPREFSWDIHITWSLPSPYKET